MKRVTENNCKSETDMHIMIQNWANLLRRSAKRQRLIGKESAELANTVKQLEKL